ncbi:MAG: orotate phosphoribosyltransferase [Lachnospiraceae bacterium]|nr:orotate phosphoribosyltransferase [Lachnospiraceae bacterium]MCD8362314.1 orotate phosphoribosyltransferase [Lachnospiraceae bacterium]
MESREFKIHAQADNRVALKVVPGHFVTSHSHINYYVDITTMRTRQNEAEAAARLLARKYENNTIVDTIICLNGCEVIGAYLAQQLSQAGFRSMNAHRTIYIMSPEQDINGQMILRDNTKPMVLNKNVLILSTSITTGVTLDKAIDSVEFYGGRVQAIASIFSMITRARGIEVTSIFGAKDMAGYASYDAKDCPMCKAKQKIDAIVNGFGYSRI